MDKYEIAALSTTLSYVAKRVESHGELLREIREEQRRQADELRRLGESLARRVITPTELRNTVARLRAQCATLRAENRKLNKALNDQFPE